MEQSVLSLAGRLLLHPKEPHQQLQQQHYPTLRIREHGMLTNVSGVFGLHPLRSTSWESNSQ